MAMKTMMRTNRRTRTHDPLYSQAVLTAPALHLSVQEQAAGVAAPVPPSSIRAAASEPDTPPVQTTPPVTTKPATTTQAATTVPTKPPTGGGGIFLPTHVARRHAGGRVSGLHMELLGCEAGAQGGLIQASKTAAPSGTPERKEGADHAEN